jgi:sugar phosphate isomerase/epimerase
LDIGHSHTAGNVDEKYITQNESKLKHVNIHDAIGKQNHLTLSEGNIILLVKLNIARHNHSRCAIKTKTVV